MLIFENNVFILFLQAGFIKEGSSHKISKRSKSITDDESREDEKERKQSNKDRICFELFQSF